MKTHTFFNCLFAGLLLSTLFASAQKITFVSGNLNFLEGQKTLKIQYNYDSLTIGKFKKEEEFIESKVVYLNKKENGLGEVWKKEWIEAKKRRYEPKFEQLLNKGMLSSSITIIPSNMTPTIPPKYSMILKTKHMDAGWNSLNVKFPAFIDVEFIFVETKNPNVILARLKADRYTGFMIPVGIGFNDWIRIQQSYAKTGKKLAQYLKKNGF